jgi:hypothetical protein
MFKFETKVTMTVNYRFAWSLRGANFLQQALSATATSTYLSGIHPLHKYRLVAASPWEQSFILTTDASSELPQKLSNRGFGQARYRNCKETWKLLASLASMANGAKSGVPALNCWKKCRVSVYRTTGFNFKCVLIKQTKYYSITNKKKSTLSANNFI